MLPFGQMSYWGATVITNLLSAVPVFGQDLVESINETKLCSCLLQLNNSIPVFTTIGTVSAQAFKKGTKIRFNKDKEEYLTIPYSFIAFLVGFIDGSGYIQVTKTTKGFISIKLVILISLEDISTLEYIYSVLKIGKITIYRDRKNPTCKLIINKTDLQEILFPLLNHHRIFFITESIRAQFDLAMFIFKNDIKSYKDIYKYKTDKELPTIFNLPPTPSDYLKLEFFNNWLVGFTNAEGSFVIPNGCFKLKQRIHLNLFEALKLLFLTNRAISIEKDKYKYLQLSVSSKGDNIINVIDFFSFSGLHPLIGSRLIEYLTWLEALGFSEHIYSRVRSAAR